MDLWTATKTVLRRWYVFVPALLVGMVAVVLVVGAVDTKYRATGKSILLAPAVGEDEQVINPYLQGGVGAMVVAIENASLDQQMQLAALAQGYDGDFLVFAQPNSGILNIQAETTVSPEHAVEGVAIVTKLVEERVLRLQSQAGAPPEQTITMGTISEPIQADTLNGSRVRAAIALTALAIFGAIAVALVVDGIARSRGLPSVGRPGGLFGRRPGRDGDAATEEAETTPVGEGAAAADRTATIEVTPEVTPAVVAVPATATAEAATRSSSATRSSATPSGTADAAATGGRGSAARNDRRPAGSRTATDGAAATAASPGAGTTSPGAGTTSPGAGTTSPGAGTTSPGAGTTSPGAGTTSPGAGTGAGRRDIDLTTAEATRAARGGGAAPGSGRPPAPDRKDDDRRPRRPGGQPADR